MKLKRILSMTLVFCMCLTMIPVIAMPTEAATPGYTVTSSYKASSYYSALCNVTLTGNQRTDIVNIALSQVGYREGSYSGDYGGADDGSYNNYTEYNYWYHNYVNSGMPVGGDNAPWCATFVSWCAEQANIPASILNRSTAAGHGASYFNVKFYSGSSTLASSSDNDSFFMGYNYTPQKGDLFFTRSWSHVGIVVGVSGSYVITVEGNTNNNGSSQGNGVYKLTWRKISDLYFGVPNYTSAPIQHTHSYTGARVYETAHPHRISQRCVDYDSCGGWTWTNEYYELKTCEQCWHADFNIGASSVSVKVGESKTISASLSGCLPDSAVLGRSVNSDVVEVTLKNQQLTFKGLKEGTTNLRLTVYSDSSMSYVIGSTSISITVKENPKKINTSVNSVGLIIGEKSSQTIYAWTSGYYDGNTSLYFSKSNTNISCSWGEWADGKAPLTITANSRGTTTLTIGVKDSNTGEVLDSTTVEVVVGAKSYTIKYNANGGTGAPGNQTKYHGETLTLSSSKPTRTGYTFLGWATNPSATSATYQPGGSFTSNVDTTLYAVWKKGCEGNNHKFVYDVTGRPTSTSIGKIVGECGYCGATTSVLLPKLNTDDYTYKVTKAATCTATGTGRYTWKITTYGGSYYFDETIPATGHSYSYKVTKAPTTSTTGTLTGTCAKCSGTITVTLPKLSTADYSYKVTKAATCAAAGVGRYTWKTTTYGSFYFDVSIPATGHSYSYTVTKTPSTSTTGILTGTCSKCAGTTTIVMPKLNKTDYDYSITTTPTCTKVGCECYSWKNKAYGGHSLFITIPAMGHTYDHDCDASCNRCGASRTINHEYAAATCTAPKTCKVCGTIGGAALGHTYDHACDLNCNRCGATRSITHDYAAATCTAPKTCTVCGATSGATLGHTYDHACDTSCNSCGTTRSITHGYETTVTKATLSSNGYIVSACTVCGDVASSTAIARPTTFTLSTVNYTYNGAVKTPGVTVKDANGKTLVKGTDYTVSYPSGRTALGTYTVTITMKGNYSGTKTLTFNIKLGAPTVTVANATNGVKISWNAISGAKNYKVYKSVYSGGKWSAWTAIKTGVTGTTYTDTSVKSNDNVKYTVRAFNGNFSSTFKSSSSIKFLATPTVKATNAAKGVTVTWNKITGAKSYTVYRAVYSGGKWSGWTAIKTGVTGTSYTDTTVKSGATVRYTVKAINGNFRSNVKTGNTTKFLAQPTVKVTKATNGIKASWGKITGASGYIVYRRTYTNGKWSGWTAIKTTTAVSFTDTTAKKGVTYQYTVRAYSGDYRSSYTNSSSIKR